MDIKSDLRQYLGIVLRWSWFLMLVALLAGVVTYIVTRRQQPIYQASTTILIEESGGTGANADYQSILTSERRALTYATLLEAKPLLIEVVGKVDPSMNANTLRNAITIEPIRSTQLLRVRVRDTNPERAAVLANTLVSTFSVRRQDSQSSRFVSSENNLKEQMSVLERQIQETTVSQSALDSSDQAGRDRLETTLSQYRQSYANLLQSYTQVRLAQTQATPTLSQEEPAETPLRPIAPRVLRSTLLAAVLGMLVAMGLVILREALDDSVQDPEELSARLGLPVLGVIANIEGVNTQPIVMAQPRSPVAEAFRNLRTNIQFAGVDRPLNTLLVTSPSPNEGKSTVISNLAMVLAQTGRRVALLEADLRRPTVHKKLELPNRFGMSNLFVQSDAHLNGALQPSGFEHLSVITSGDLPPNPVELLGSEKMIEILASVRQEADIVLIDTPPVLAVTDAVVLAQRVDGVLLVVRAGVTKLAAAKQAVDQLRFVGANPIGVVMNGIPLSRSRYGYGYSYHGYYYAYQTDESAPRKPKWRLPSLRRKSSQSKTKAQEVQA